MLTEEQYRNIRNSGKVSTFLCFHYWQENKPSNYKELTLEEFESQFTLFLQRYNGSVINSPYGIDKEIQIPQIANKVVTYYDNKFGISGSMKSTTDIPDNQTNV